MKANSHAKHVTYITHAYSRPEVNEIAKTKIRLTIKHMDSFFSIAFDLLFISVCFFYRLIWWFFCSDLLNCNNWLDSNIFRSFSLKIWWHCVLYRKGHMWDFICTLMLDAAAFTCFILNQFHSIQWNIFTPLWTLFDWLKFYCVKIILGCILLFFWLKQKLISTTHRIPVKNVTWYIIGIFSKYNWSLNCWFSCDKSLANT